MNTPDIKELEQEILFLQTTNKGIRKSLDEISILQNILKGFAESRSISSTIVQFMEVIRFYFSIKGSIFYQLDIENLEFSPTFQDSIDDKKIKDHFEINESILIWILNEKQVSTVPPQVSNPDPKQNLLLVPFCTMTSLIGVMAIITCDEIEELLTLETRKMLDLSASQAAVSIENLQLYKNMEEQNKNLEKVQSFTSNILESLHSGIITVNMEKVITHINHNASVMFGISDINPVGQVYESILKKSLSDMMNLLFSQTIEKGCVLDYQMEFELPGGAIIPYAISTAQLRDRKQEIIGITFITRDMTASRELDRLRKLDKLKNDFVSTVSHELRSPMATIKAYIDTLINRVEPEDHETRQMFLQTIEDEANRLTSLVEDMLDIASIESGKIQLELQTLSIDPIIESAKKLCSMQTETHTIHSDIQPNLPTLNLDKDRITQVLINLVNNAIKYSPEGGNIWIRAYEEQGAVKIDVSDEGLGIKEDDLAHLFEKFFRVDSEKTSNIGGTGLGLSIVRKLTELHGGKIDVTSTYGEGSTFSILLPA